jgi:putative hydrolase of the HAD superfamily
MNVFYARATPVKGAKAILKKLCSHGYFLAILSAGEEWVQKKRTDDYDLRGMFRVCEILEHKTESEFRNFCNTHEVDVSTSWMVGDSVRSDILPAQAAGLHVIHIESSNWSAEHDKIPEDVQSVRAISGIMPIILGETCSA